jgi:hypothetical protein
VLAFGVVLPIERKDVRMALILVALAVGADSCGTSGSGEGRQSSHRHHFATADKRRRQAAICEQQVNGLDAQVEQPGCFFAADEQRRCETFWIFHFVVSSV